MPHWPGREETRDVWRRIAEAREERRPVVVATVARSTGSVPRRIGAKMLIYGSGSVFGSIGGGLFEALVKEEAMAALEARHSRHRTWSFNPKGASPHAFGAVCGGRADVLLEVLMPTDRLLIVGGGHCGRALARLAAGLDFEIDVVDDRSDVAVSEAFPWENVRSVTCLPPDMEGLPDPDEQTWVALVSKGLATDEAALRRVLRSDCAYIGMIGSRRKRDLVFEHLRAEGADEELLQRVHAPIGLEIGAETPEEIAISILAEIIQLRSARQTQAPA
ncbi:MAG: XdhC family protein [Armatimonadetes bacterium]|nr:XdhC family protein [Armatimonadota bacterium]MDE2205624.1 XdhC family protein [Armatimonadota bacterium]